MEKIKLSINGNSGKAFLSYFNPCSDFEIVEQSADVALFTELKTDTDAVSAEKKFFVDAIVLKPIAAKVLALIAEGKIGAVQSADFSLNAPEGVSEEKLRSCIYLLLAICGEKIKDKTSQDCASGYRHGFVALQLKNGSVVRLTYAGAAGEKREYCCIYGTLGEIRLDLQCGRARFFKQEPNYKGDEIKPTLAADRFFATQLKNAVQNGKNTVFLSVDDTGLLDL